MAAATVAFDKPVYVPGELITMTVTVTAEDPEPVEHTIEGRVSLSNGDIATFTGRVTVDAEGAHVSDVALTADGGFRWSAPTVVSPTVVQFTAVA